jgi:hypothetical protein
MPKENPMTSTSGIMEQSMARVQNWFGTSLGANATPVATATAACEMSEGTVNSLYNGSTV